MTDHIPATDLILAIDTTNAHGSLALSQGPNLMEEIALHAPEGYSELLLPAIEDLLARHSVAVGDIALFASASGPGTFTGVRVGLACVKGLADALCKPAVAVSNLEALASFGSKPLRAVTLDARRNEFYTALYNSFGQALLPERVSSLEAFQSTLPDADIEWVSHTGPLAAAIARIAARRLARGRTSDPAAIEANYVRRSDAELHLISQPSSRRRT